MPQGILVERRGSGAAQREDAKRSIKRFKSQGHPVDPDDPAHMEAYLKLRKMVDRVDAHRFLGYLNNQKTTISHAASSYLEYWAVSKRLGRARQSKPCVMHVRLRHRQRPSVGGAADSHRRLRS